MDKLGGCAVDKLGGCALNNPAGLVPPCAVDKSAGAQGTWSLTKYPEIRPRLISDQVRRPGIRWATGPVRVPTQSLLQVFGDGERRRLGTFQGSR